MKKFGSILIFLFFCWQFIGSYLYFENEKRIILLEAKRKIENSTTHFTTLHFTRKEFNQIIWVKKNEFKFESNMYDVKSIVKQKDGINVICIADKAEKRFMQHSANLFQIKKTTNNVESPFPLWDKLVDSDYFLSIFKVKLFIFQEEMNTGKTLFHLIEKLSSKHLQAIFTPPI